MNQSIAILDPLNGIIYAGLPKSIRHERHVVPVVISHDDFTQPLHTAIFISDSAALAIRNFADNRCGCKKPQKAGENVPKYLVFNRLCREARLFLLSSSSCSSSVIF